MGFLLFLLFAVLAFSAVTFSLKNERLKSVISAFQILSVLAALVYFVALFVNRSIETKNADGLSIQIINELPQTIDFYLIKVENKKNEISHIGTIRTDYYRLEQLQAKNSDRFRILGMLGKNPVYFSENKIQNINIDQIITVKNYSIDDEELAESSLKQIANYNSSVRNTAVWMSLDLLLLFLNAMLLWRKYRRLIFNV